MRLLSLESALDLLHPMQEEQVAFAFKTYALYRPCAEITDHKNTKNETQE